MLCDFYVDTHEKDSIISVDSVSDLVVESKYLKFEIQPKYLAESSGCRSASVWTANGD